jgi:raffinose/stachyose/melibiose transport system permease protein
MSATSVEERATRVAATRKKRAGTVAMTVVLGIAAIVWLSPLAMLIITALRPLSDYIANGALTWPKQFTTANFAEAWAVGNFATTYRNSFIITVVKVPLGVFFASLLAYAIAKLRLPGRKIVMFSVFLGLTVPIYIAILPNFVMLRQLGLTDTLAGLVGPYLAFGISFEVLVLQSFFRGIPDEIIEAARVDGASPARIFFQIMLPLSTPALVTVAILDGVGTWNEFLMALIILNSNDNKTIPVGLLNFQGQFANNTTSLAAGILIAVVPILIAYIFLQRWIVGGLTAGATKG